MYLERMQVQVERLVAELLHRIHRPPQRAVLDQRLLREPGQRHRGAGGRLHVREQLLGSRGALEYVRDLVLDNCHLYCYCMYLYM